MLTKTKLQVEFTSDYVGELAYSVGLSSVTACLQFWFLSIFIFVFFPLIKLCVFSNCAFTNCVCAFTIYFFSNVFVFPLINTENKKQNEDDADDMDGFDADEEDDEEVDSDKEMGLDDEDGDEVSSLQLQKLAAEVCF